jgi:RNA-directed DNA polymerase
VNTRELIQRFPNGKARILRVPTGPLKALQQRIKARIIDVVPVASCVHGGVRGRSVVTNALPHLRKPVVFSVDVMDFFPSVNTNNVRKIFERLAFGPEAASVLTALTTWDNQLPQGASTSTGLSNLSMARVDGRLQRLAVLHQFAYTRYIDDLTLSGGKRLLGFRSLICTVVEEEGFLVNPEKNPDNACGHASDGNWASS